jgi:hypothetical protein
VLLLAALSWPLVFAIKLGQVGPLLLLLFSIGWRWLDRPWPLGVSAGLGTLIKLQPALLIAWAAVTGRRAAALVGVVLVAGVAGIATVVAGPQSWIDELSLLGRVSQPALTANSVGLARVAFEAGLPVTTAMALHWANLAGLVVVVAFIVLRGSAEASYLAVVVATQFVSPVIWDHYALMLLLPTAWLINRGWLVAAIIPLATATVIAGPPITYTIAFWVTLGGLAWVGTRDSRRPELAMAASTP